MDRCKYYMKYFLIAINLIILISGIFVTVVTLCLIDKLSLIRSAENVQLNVTIIVLLVVGIIMMSIAILGIVAALQEAKYMLQIYTILAFLVFLIGIFISIWKYNSNKELMKMFEKKVESLIQFYNNDTFIHDFWDTAQSKLYCCGVNSWEDWETHGFKVPDSCCESDQRLHCNANPHTKNIPAVYTKGCLNKMRILMQYFTSITNGISITLSCLMFFGMISSGELYKKIELQHKYEIESEDVFDKKNQKSNKKSSSTRSIYMRLHEASMYSTIKQNAVNQ
ncbi:CD151 antigen isoform X1 [Solenopsis invicta]|uniref:CD151 antigen isoform X1 n=1 Tax=Solenopsis invicta TaxID=13686 RepID=UPI00193CAD42|nr:CD151 antigen isoform X1 [Solenopsis invicta]XP_025992480.2 CD151 antigen isoform X1 [Solenopsis invicta]